MPACPACAAAKSGETSVFSSRASTSTSPGASSRSATSADLTRRRATPTRLAAGTSAATGSAAACRQASTAPASPSSAASTSLCAGEDSSSRAAAATAAAPRRTITCARARSGSILGQREVVLHVRQVVCGLNRGGGELERWRDVIEQVRPWLERGGANVRVRKTGTWRGGSLKFETIGSGRIGGGIFCGCPVKHLLLAAALPRHQLSEVSVTKSPKTNKKNLGKKLG